MISWKNSALVVFVLSSCSSLATRYSTYGDYLEITVPVDTVQVDCTEEDKEDKNSFFVVKTLANGRAFEFYTRRPLDKDTCAWRVKEANQVLSTGSTVTVTGSRIGPRPQAKVTSVSLLEEDWFFEKIFSAKKCHTYFDGKCGEDIANRFEK